jgi:hypothetical protein
MTRRGFEDFASFATTVMVKGRMLDAERKIHTRQGLVSRPDQVVKAKCTRRALEAAEERGELPCPRVVAQAIYERVIKYVQYGEDLPEYGRELPYRRIGRNLPETRQDVSPPVVAHWWELIRRALEANSAAAKLLAHHVDGHTQHLIHLSSSPIEGESSEFSDEIESGTPFVGGAPGWDPIEDAMQTAKHRAALDVASGAEAGEALRSAIEGEFGSGVAARMMEADPEAWSEVIADMRELAEFV